MSTEMGYSYRTNVTKLRNTMNARQLKDSIAALDKIITHVGNMRILAKMLGVRYQNISYWRCAIKAPDVSKCRKIPFRHLTRLVKISNNTVSRAELRPDIFEE